MRHGLSSIAACSVSLALFAGCTAAKSDLTSAPPEFPPAAKKDSEQGATTFATHWMDLVEHGHATMDAEPIRDFGLASCATCAQFVQQLDTDNAAGTRYEGGTIRVLNAEPTSHTAGKRAEVGVLFEQDKLEVLDRAGTAVETIPKSTVMFMFDLRWTDRGWRAAHVRMVLDDKKKKQGK